MRNSVPAGLFAVLSLGSGAWAQAPTFNTVVLNFPQADGDAYNETSVSVSRVNPNHLIVACNYQRPPFFGNFRKLYYGISTTGILGSHGSQWSQRGELPLPPGYSGTDWQWFDPMTAASQNSDNLWVGCVLRLGPVPIEQAGFAVWRNTAGTGTLALSDPSVINPLAGSKDDKGMLAVGPDRGNPGVETMYLGFTRVNHPDQLNTLMWRKSANGTPGTSWAPPETRILPADPDPQNPPQPRIGFGAMPVVQASGTDAGKLIMVYESPILGWGPSNMITIEVCRHDAPETSQEPGWGTPIRLDRETGGADIFPVEGMSAFTGTMAVGKHPSICRDPADPSTVYVAFIGSVTQHPDIVNPDPPIDQNVDIYISKITYGTTITVLTQRITDQMLGDVSAGLFQNGADQFFPTVTVDGYGGLNLAYMRMPHLPPIDIVNPPVDVTYVRMPQFPVSPSSMLTTYRLTPLYTPFPDQTPRVGDYISIDSSGCLIYVAYPKVEAGYTDRCSTYVTRISICQADIDSTGIVDSGDAMAFGQGFSQGSQNTDMNGDGVHNGTDVQCFLNAYTCGCAQQP